MSTARCPKCSFVSPLASELCPRCGAELDPPVTSNYSGDDARRSQFSYQETNTCGFNSNYPIEPGVEIGNILATTYSLFIKNIWLITKLVVVIFAPLEIFKLLNFSTPHWNWQEALGTAALSILCQTLISPSIIYSLFKLRQTGIAPSLTDAYRWGLSRLWKVFVVSLMSGILIGLGLILLVIPGIILIMGFEVVYPLATLENESAVGVLERSWQLTRGHRWHIFVVLFVLLIGNLVLNFLISIPLGIVGALAVPVWPLAAAVAVLTDIISVIFTVASLVIYLSIIESQPPEVVNEH